MKTRVPGIVVALLSAWVALFGLRGVATDASVGEGMSEIAKAIGQTIDPAEWVLHWRVNGAVLLLFGLCGFAVGVAIYFQSRWRWIMLASIAFVALVFEWGRAFTPFAKFGFEQPHLVRSAILLVVFASAIVAQRKLQVQGVTGTVA